MMKLRRHDPFIVIGVFKLDPGRRRNTLANHLHISHSLYKIIENALMLDQKKFYLELRDPGTRMAPGTFKWHQDCEGHADYVVLWSSEHPTQIRYAGGRKVYQPKPFEVVLINNATARHRRPMSAKNARTRWMAVCRIFSHNKGR